MMCDSIHLSDLSQLSESLVFLCLLSFPLSLLISVLNFPLLLHILGLKIPLSTLASKQSEDPTLS